MCEILLSREIVFVLTRSLYLCSTCSLTTTSTPILCWELRSKRHLPTSKRPTASSRGPTTLTSILRRLLMRVHTTQHTGNCVILCGNCIGSVSWIVLNVAATHFCSTQGAQERFIEISRAYSVLGDQDERCVWRERAALGPRRMCVCAAGRVETLRMHARTHIRVCVCVY